MGGLIKMNEWLLSRRNKSKSKDVDDLQTRIDNIKASIERIHVLMQQLKELDTPCTDVD